MGGVDVLVVVVEEEEEEDGGGAEEVAAGAVEVDEEDEEEGCFTPVILTILLPKDWDSSIRSAEPSLSSEKESMSAIGLQPVDLQMNSTSSRSMSLMQRMLSLARKCSDKSLTASRRMDFWMSRALHLDFLIFFTRLRR